MILFLAYTIVAWIATASVVKVLHISIQPGQWLDKLLNWQQRLQAWDMHGNEFAAKVGGYCEACFSHLLSFAAFWVYLFFMNAVLGVWITDGVDGWWIKAVANAVWYLVYVSVATNLSLYFIVKLFNR